ncbi:hypothetical protein B0T18DRAFT_490494 [Schizothecium vesticola]|uniref:Apple domain-containing protein n=1 Tax=Schizothecium vesticola TaxID=314040 RepID=A0AA40K2U9_9PEZI|nr:hypothetical protein B0T18DRAFT_490494 [Schizothecium vesticola]
MASHQFPEGHPANQYQPHDIAAEKAGQYHYQQTQLPAGYTQDDPSVVSIKRSLSRWFLLAFTILFLCVIGLSAGLGVSQQSLHQTETNLQAAQQAVTAAEAQTAGATTVYLTRTPTSPTPTPSATVKSDVQCPAINGTSYTAASNTTSSGTSKAFVLLCGLDYGDKEATDIGSVKVRNLSACAEACAKKTNCTGAGWGVIKGDKGPEHTCWLKTDLIKSHNATGEWGFARLIEDGK